MKKLGVLMTVVVLGSLVFRSVAGASLTRVSVSKGNALEKELGYTLAVTPNGPNSGSEATVTFEIQGPRTRKLQNLSRVILRMHQGKDLTARLPLELQKGKAGEIQCHFQLTPALAKGSVLELICPTPDEPNGIVYEIDLSAYVTPEERAEESSADAPVKLEISLENGEYSFRAAIPLTLTYTNTSKETVVLTANGISPGAGFPGETFEVTSAAGRKTYTIFAVDPLVKQITLEPGKSWKRKIEDLASVLSNTGAANVDKLPDPFGQPDEYSLRVMFQLQVKAQPKPAFNGKVTSEAVKFKVDLR